MKFEEERLRLATEVHLFQKIAIDRLYSARAIEIEISSDEIMTGMGCDEMGHRPTGTEKMTSGGSKAGDAIGICEVVTMMSLREGETTDRLLLGTID